MSKDSILRKTFWERTQFILNTIRFGYKIPFISRPPTVSLGNNRSALDEPEFVKESIKDLIM